MDFREWFGSRPIDWLVAGPGSAGRREYARMNHNYGAVGPTGSGDYRWKDLTFHTDDEPGDQEAREMLAWNYLVYLKWCERKGQEPGPYVNLFAKRHRQLVEDEDLDQ